MRHFSLHYGRSFILPYTRFGKIRGVLIPEAHSSAELLRWDMFIDRILQLKMPGDTFEISIRVFFPEGADNKWRCRYEIDWPEGRQAISATGTDGVQALSNALCMIGADLYTSSYHKEGQIQY
ncbi:DUF6968 family protein [Roseixanthobacter liquoris]|uniref:DUF6968 family protein n=1 Tax=Roseixanthobacter liquoris TaxID=3119921 RepID=UPI0037262D12